MTTQQTQVVSCPTCGGTGKLNERVSFRPRRCPTCNGTRVIVLYREEVSTDE